MSSQADALLALTVLDENDVSAAGQATEISNIVPVHGPINVRFRIEGDAVSFGITITQLPGAVGVSCI